MRHSEQMRKQSRHDQNTVEYGLTAEQASRQSTVLDNKSHLILSGTILGESKAWDFIDLCSMTSEDSNRWKVWQTGFVSSVSLGSRLRCHLPYKCIWSQSHGHSFFFLCLVFPWSHLIALLCPLPPPLLPSHPGMHVSLWISSSDGGLMPLLSQLQDFKVSHWKCCWMRSWSPVPWFRTFRVVHAHECGLRP